MRKLVSIAICCIAIMANATNKTEMTATDTEDIVAKTTGVSDIAICNTVELNIENNNFKHETLQADMLVGCGADGNSMYAMWRGEGLSHRAARKKRRAFVRECRDYFWQFGL